MRAAARQGSPPLARELHVYNITLYCVVGITPARAGTTIRVSTSSCMDKDHPRSRGNYVLFSLQIATNPGSPPLARELRALRQEDNLQVRITPARAGTTYYSDNDNYGYRDHPRSRGNYTQSEVCKEMKRGSPPLARELLSVCSQHIIFSLNH